MITIDPLDDEAILDERMTRSKGKQSRQLRQARLDEIKHEQAPRAGLWDLLSRLLHGKQGKEG